jgi:hypothetical protein
MKDNNYPTKDDLRNSDISAINAMIKPSEDPADAGAPREFPPEPAYKTGIKVRVVRISDGLRKDLVGKEGEIGEQIAKPFFGSRVYRVIFTNGYSSIVFHDELELIPVFEIEVTQFLGTVKIEVSGIEEDGFDYCLLDEFGNGIGGQMHYSTSDNAIHAAQTEARRYLARTFSERRKELES